MKNIYVKILIVIWFVFPLSSMNVYAGDHQWLVGVWELNFDPDGDTKDWLEFTQDGKAYSVDSKHTRQVPGTYELTPSNINITFNWKGKVIPIVLTYKKNKDALYAVSKKTGNTSIYKKVK